MGWEIVIGAISGLLGAATGIVGYVRYRAMHPVEVRQGEATAQRQEIDNLKLIIQVHREEIERMRTETREMHTQLNQERTDCDIKIAALSERLDKVVDELQRVRTRCLGSCFNDSK